MYVYVAWHMGGDRSGTRKGPRPPPGYAHPLPFTSSPWGAAARRCWKEQSGGWGGVPDGLWGPRNPLGWQVYRKALRMGCTAALVLRSLEKCGSSLGLYKLCSPAASIF